MRSAENRKSNNKGMTLVEMIVCFALLGMFLVAATTVITSVVNLYYQIRGESYARQVGDIIENKIVGELEGTRFFESDTSPDNITIDNTPTESGNSVSLYDKTNTKVKIYAEDGDYAAISKPSAEDSRVATTWTFDKKVYNGYSLESLDFAPANNVMCENLAQEYGVDGISCTDYDSNVIVVFMKLTSPKYGGFTVYRFIRLYDLPEKEYNGSAYSIKVYNP